MHCGNEEEYDIETERGDVIDDEDGNVIMSDQPFSTAQPSSSAQPPSSTHY